MRNLVKLTVVMTAFAALAACGGSNEPAKEPSMENPTPSMTAPAPTTTSTGEPITPPETANPPTSSMGGGMDGTMGGMQPGGMQQGTTGTSGMGGETGTMGAKEKMTDSDIAAVVNAANSGQMELAQLAAKNAQSGQVKSFASMMVTQQKDVANKAKTVEQTARIAPTDNDVSLQLKSDTETTLTTLKGQKGKDFDRTYMDSQVKIQREVLDTIDNKLMPAAQNGELKTHLTDVRKKVSDNLTKAQQIDDKLNSSSTGTAPAGGTKKGTTTKPNQ
ncbi:hypothetical protein AKJ09_08736 [Labilithrix luteola]|uniref:DUF4142 domain-containing protein n=1 Tax=Labilithrix luteola TaxID=1391654 RepID=A0A0K1Q8J8_9BACT|nr:DUF4142 domain-containing protein [Labilithrix luteola]AKV02073.1 hypothetical protein AKJ09_08736 [Labilithrix luteola]